MKLESVVLISFAYFGERLLKKVVEDVQHQFLRPVRINEGHLDLSEYFNATRNQYDANKLLKEIDTKFAIDYQKTLCIFRVDLFIYPSSLTFSARLF